MQLHSPCPRTAHNAAGADRKAKTKPLVFRKVPHSDKRRAMAIVANSRNATVLGKVMLAKIDIFVTLK